MGIYIFVYMYESIYIHVYSRDTNKNNMIVDTKVKVSNFFFKKAFF
jgi:hypothetical protein